jgi:hydrogenase maturation protease
LSELCQHNHSLVVIGVGNTLRSDDGIGGVVVRAIEKQCTAMPAIHCIDAGSEGMRLVHLLAGHAKAIVVDCAIMGERPGTIRRLAPQDLNAAHCTRALSLHEGNILESITLLQALGEAPNEIVLYGIEPVDLSPGTSLSPVLKAHVPAYVRLILTEISPRYA